MNQYSRKYVRTASFRDVCEYCSIDGVKLKYITTACAKDAPRPGKL